MSDRPGTAPFALTAKALVALAGSPLGGTLDEAFPWWAQFVDTIGPALLPFLTRPEEYVRAPIEELGLASTPLESLTPRRGEMWVLFCFRPGEMQKALAESPLRSDGFPLILEWRKGDADSPLLSSALRVLAARVRQQLGVDGWCLCPAFDRYGDMVDFTDAELFADSEHVDNVASAWGALAAGLQCATTGRHPPEWPFPSIQWDEKRQCMAGVAGLGQKFSVAADCGASVVTVARAQRREAAGALADLRSGIDGHRFKALRLHFARDRRRAREGAAEVAFGFFNDRRRRRRILAAVLVPLLALLSLLGVYHWDTHRAFSKYYAAITYHYGLPEGLYEVSPEAQKMRGSTFRFDYAGVHHCAPSVHHRWQLKDMFGHARKLDRVVQVNARNVPKPIDCEGFGEMPMIQQYSYDEDGRVETVLCPTRGGDDLVSGPVEKRIVYDNYDRVVNGHAVLRSGDGKEYYYGAVRLSHVDENLPQDGCSEVFEYVLQRDEEGRVVRKMFRNRLDPVCDGDGVGGFLFAYNADGLISERTNLDVGNTNAVPNQWGVVHTSYRWDGPLLKDVINHDAAMRPICDRIGVMHYSYRHDDEGNPIACLVLDGAGKPTCNKTSHEWENKFSECRFTWTNGLMRTRMFLGMSGDETDVLLANDNMPGMLWQRTQQGDVCSETYLDANGQPTTNSCGVSTSRFTVDERTGKVLYAVNYGLDGNTPVCDDGASCAYSNVLDSAGNYISLRYLGPQGRLATNQFGTAICNTEYDDRGRCIYQVHLGVDGKPHFSGHFLAMEVLWKHGRISEYRYCAGDDARTTLTNAIGVSREFLHYDDSGRLMRHTFLSVPGTGNSIHLGGREPDCAKYDIHYDGRGNMTCVKHYDAKGNLLNMPGCSFAYSYHEYDCRGRRIAISLYDSRENKLLRREERVK